MAILVKDGLSDGPPGKTLEKHIETSAAGSILLDLSTWKEFQDGLAVLIDVPLSLYSKSGELLVPAAKCNPLCAAIGSREAGKSRCSDSISRAISNAVERGKVYIFKCHANQ